MRLVGSPETSVSNHLTPRNNPEDGRKHFFFIFKEGKYSHVITMQSLFPNLSVNQLTDFHEISYTCYASANSHKERPQFQATAAVSLRASLLCDVV
jgi:hypothetical protein